MKEGSKPVFRIAVPACKTAETYKYFLPAEEATRVWSALEERYGGIRKDPSFKIQEIEASQFWLRSTWQGSPITVIRKRTCGAADIEELHRYVGFKI